MFKKIAGIFIYNKELGVLVILFIIAFGLTGFVFMPKQYNPEIVAPAFRISTQFPGATSEEVYELVTRPMEDKLSEIRDVDDIYSQSSPEFSSVLVAFEIGSDEGTAKIDLVQRLRSNMHEQPMGAGDPLIEAVDTDDVPIITLAITSDKLSLSSLRSFSFDLVDKIKHVNNTAKIKIHGGRTNGLAVFLDADKLNTYNIGVSEVMTAIKKNNWHVSSVATDNSPHNTVVRIFGNITSMESLNKIIIASNNESVIRIEDVANVKNSPMVIDSYARIENRDESKDAVYVGISKQNGSNATTVAKEIKNKLETFREQGEIPEYVDVKIVRNTGAVAGESIGGLTTNLVTSILIVITILLLFLNTRSAVVVAIAIPLSLLSVFGVGLLFDQTINRITLFALILSLGLLVDSATVVVENMYRHLKKYQSERGNKGNNKTREDVITDAVAEVGGGLVMSTITTVLAFVPMAFVTGMMGPYMGPIPFFVPAAIIASLFIALTISPFVGNSILSTKESGRGLLNKIRAKIRRGVQYIENSYEKFILSIFANRKKQNILLGLIGALLLLSMLLPAVSLVKFRMLPKADRNQFYIYLDAINNTHIDKTNELAGEVSKIVLKNEDVFNIQTTVGIPPVIDFNGLFKGSDSRKESHQATLKINLVDKNDREVTSEDIAIAVRKSLLEFGVKNNVNIKIIEDPPGPPVLSTYQVKVQSDNRENYSELRDIAQELATQTRSIKGVVDIDTSSTEHSIEKVYRVNTEEASRVGVNVEDVMFAVRLFLHGVNVSIYHDSLDNEQRFAEARYISLRADNEGRDGVNDFSNINVRAKTGALISVESLLREIKMPVDNIVRMDARKPTVYVDGEMQGRSVIYASIDMLKYLVTKYKLPSEKGEVVSWNLFGVQYKDEDGKQYEVNIGGEWELTLEVFRDMGIAFAGAIFLIYFVLVAQFKSLRVPLYIMGTIPLALIGVLPGFLILYVTKDTYFTATSMIGVIALAGIVVNNAIIYLEYVFQLRDRGMEIEDALVKAGKTRLLPIALTSLTTILGSLTIISDPVWEGLAWAIITGLSLSAFLTLVILPIIYRIFEKKEWDDIISNK